MRRYLLFNKLSEFFINMLKNRSFNGYFCIFSFFRCQKRIFVKKIPLESSLFYNFY